jgi:putative restriction endonuclease
MLDSYLKKFSTIDTEKDETKYPSVTFHRNPHKPVMLLAVMDLIARGTIRENFIEPSLDLIEIFNSYWGNIMPQGVAPSITLPFTCLQSDGFWDPIPRTEENSDPNDLMTIITCLRAIYAGARMDDDLFQIMLVPDTLEQLRHIIITTYFASEIHKSLLEQRDINLAVYHYSRLLIDDFGNKPYWSDEGEESIKSQHIRTKGFHHAIVRLYDHKCAFCGIRMVMADGHSMVESAHIKPWAQSRDDRPSNGLALCRLCHWTFREGLMGVGDNYEVLVSNQVKESHDVYRHILNLANWPIFKPESKNFWPAQENLAWHREQVFNK